MSKLGWCIASVIAIMAILLILTGARAEPLSFSWDAVTDERVAGYRLYMSTESANYTFGPGKELADIPGGDTTVIVQPPPGKFYFVVTAYSARGEESPPSNEIPWGLEAPENFKVTETRTTKTVTETTTTKSIETK